MSLMGLNFKKSCLPPDVCTHGDVCVYVAFQILKTVAAIKI